MMAAPCSTDQPVARRNGLVVILLEENVPILAVQFCKFLLPNYLEKWYGRLVMKLPRRKKFRVSPLSLIPKKWRRALAIVAVLALVAAGPGAYLVLHHPTQAQAAWFDSRWGFRQAITLTVTSSASDISKLQTLVTINTSALITAGKLQSACQDLRFTSNVGVALPYYIDSGCNTTTTKVWVQADLVPKNTTAYVLYMYYGNNSAVAGSDQSTTYNFNLVKGLVGYWTMNDTSWTNNCSTPTVTDSSVNANNGLSCANASGLIGGAAGQFGNGAQLNGSTQYISVPNSTALAAITGDVTFSMWLKPGSSQVAYADILSKHSNGGFTIEQNSSTTNQYYLSWDTGGGSYTCGGTYFNLTASVWQHLLISKSGATETYYINGSSAGSCTGSSATIANNTLPIFLGNWSSGGSRYWNGSMDDVRIYNRALSVTEAKQLYTYTGSILTTTPATIATSTAFAAEEVGTNPLIYYKFDEGTSTIAHNSGSGNTAWAGTLTNMSSPPATNSGWMLEDQCVTGKCLRFNGANNYVTTSAQQGPQSGMSISTWVNPNTLTGTQMIATQYDGTNAYMQLFEISGTVYFRINQVAAATFIGRNTGAVLTTNKWQHIEATWNGGTTSSSIAIYINGVQADISNNQLGSFTAPYSGTVPLTIGAQFAGASPFNGTIDEFKMFNYARSLAQVKTDFNLFANKAGALPQSLLDNGLVGYWKMDEASWNGTAGEVRDSSGTGNNGTGGASVTTGAGKYGLGGVFNGTTQYVSVANNSTLNIATNITAAAWVYPTTISGAAEIINKKTDAGSSGYRLRRSGATIIFEYSDGATVRIQVISPIKLVANQWQHVAATYDGQKVRIFYNGTEVYEEAHTGAMITNTSTLYLGAYNALNAYWWAGSLDEVRLYNRALSPAEITQLYTFAPGPVGYWKFEQASWNGTTGEVLDSSGYNMNGTAMCYTTGCTVPTTTTFGRYGHGAAVTDIDSTHVGYISVPDIGANDPLRMGGVANLSAEAWFKSPNFFGGGTTQNFIVSKYSYGSNQGYSIYVTQTGQVAVNINGSLNIYTTPANTITTNMWYHIALVFSNGNNISIYVNGVQKLNQAVTATTLNAFTSALTIGTASDSVGSNVFSSQATIDDVRVYNYARTLAQIQDDMRGTNSTNPALSLLSGSATSSSRLQPSDAIAYFKLNEGFGTLANNSGSAGSTLSGTLSNFSSPATSTSGWQSAASSVCKIGNCLAFNGTNNFINIPDGSSVANSPGDISFSAWVKPAALDGTFRDVLAKVVSNAGSRNYGLGLNSSNQWRAHFYVGGTEYDAVATGITPSTTAWTHLVGVRSGSWGYIYVNGVLAGSVPVVGNLNTNNCSLTIGYMTGGAEYFNGLIDEVKVYNFALNQDQINSDYNYGSSLTLGGVLSSTEASNDLLDTAGAPPVALYNFSENTGLTVNDSSGNTNTGAWAGFVSSQWWPGKYGSAAKFNGQDNIQVNSSSSLNLSTYTVGFWVKSAQAPTTANVQQVFNKAITNVGIDGSSNYLFSWNHSSASYKQACAHSVSGIFSSAQLTSTLNANTWYYITCSYDGTNLKAYLNGVLQATTSVAAPDMGNFNLYLGSSQLSNTPSSYFNGTIDDFKIYNYARTPGQIAYDYNRGGPTAWWKFDENQGTTVNDSSGASTGQTGTWNGTLGSQWGTGKINTAGVFNGTNNNVSGTGPNLANSNFSVAAWVYQNSAPGFAASWFSIGSVADTDTLLGGIVYTDGHVRFGFWNDDLDTPAGAFGFARWNHVVFTYNSATKIRVIYINGAPITSGTASANFSGTTTFNLGSYNANNWWNGKIDDVRIYNYALSQNQINKIYNNGAIDYGPTSGSP